MYLFLSGLLGGCALAPLEGGAAADARLTEQVRVALAGLPALDVADIQVNAYQGIVELAGQVSSDAQRENVVQTARRLDGVKSVKDSLTVR